MSIEDLQKDNEVLPIMLSLLKKVMDSTQEMSDTTEALCKEHELKMELSKFDKSSFDKKAKEVQELLNK